MLYSRIQSFIKSYLKGLVIVYFYVVYFLMSFTNSKLCTATLSAVFCGTLFALHPNKYRKNVLCKRYFKVSKFTILKHIIIP